MVTVFAMAFGVVKAVMDFVAGRLSERTGRNLDAAVADITPPAWRGSAIGIYRFWRDIGYGIGALGLGLAAHLAGALEAAFWFVALSMFISGALLYFWGEETHPSLNPEDAAIREDVAEKSAR